MPRSTRSTILDVALLFVLASTAAVPAPAQLPAWSSIPATASQTVQLEQSLLVVTQGNTVRAFSALTKSWTAISTLFGTPAVTLMNEHVVVRDGPMYYGYSPRTGAFTSVFVSSPAPTIVGVASPQTWHTVVIDGSLLHVFYAFSGQWISYAFPSAPVVTTAMNGRYCFLVSEGGNLFGVSSFHGALVAAPPGATALGAWGNVGIASSSGWVHGFSAARASWASMPAAATPVVTTGNAQPACVAINDGVSLSMFSGHTGWFTTLPVPATAGLHLDRYVAVALDGSNAHAYSALLGTSASLAFAAPPTVIKQQMFVLLDDGSNLTAYSPAKGAFGISIPTGGMTLQTRAQIATLTPAGSGAPAAVYSSYRNEWFGGPGAGGAASYLTAASVVVESAGGGLWGWSLRGDGWIHQPAPALEVAIAGTSPPALAETFFGRAGTTLYTFNPRTGAWRTTTTTAAATLVRAHHSVVVAQDGLAAYAFDLWSDRWTTQPLQAPYSNGGGQVQAAWVTDGVGVHAYGGMGQLAMSGEFPDFYRATTIGSRLALQIAGETGAWMLLGVSLVPATIPVPPAGTLFLDPASIVLIVNGSIAGSGIFELGIQLPADPALSGLTPHFQAAIAGPAGLYLTNSVFPTIY
jgi:hypothetical protein